MRILVSIVFGLLPIASHCLDAARTTLARRGVLARALAAPAAALAGVLAPGAANAGIADQLEAASRASEITYSQNGKNFARMAAGDNSMGSKKNTSLEPRAMKRRATMGCKSGKVLAQARFADEKSCTVAVLDGPGVQRVVDALDTLGAECQVDATHVCL
mmetsp:Transcript_2138/g.4938  ORF Transcript_2138/g.4938 Transcript_2138/m.4938 type:complete len:160 (-) Transcript_2138:35-514(-)